MRASLKPCADCGVLSRRCRCPKHRVAHRRAKDRREAEKPWSHVYRSAGWAKVRAQVLADHPACERCGEPSNSVDHIKPLRELWNGDGFDLSPLERSNLRALCEGCHGRLTTRRR